MSSEADIVAYRGTEGLYAGISLSGGILDVYEDAMYAYYRLDEPEVRTYYGEEEAEIARKVLEAGQDRKISENAPQSAKGLQEAMNRM